MTLERVRALVEAQARLLGPRLYEGVAFGIQDAATRAKGFKHTKYPHLRPLLTRASLREFLEAEELPGDWQVDGNPTLMGQLIISEPIMRLSLRVLKERRRTYPGGIPVAGRNPARQRLWQAPLFSLDPPESTALVNELLLLWDYADEEIVEAGFTLRVVHPIETGVHGRAVRCDLDFNVQAGGTVFETLSFQSDPAVEDFFQADLDVAANSDG